MRPRVFPAEDCVMSTHMVNPFSSRFNEAAGIPRGRLESASIRTDEWLSFNEAAGIPRGRPPPVTDSTPFVAALQ